MASMIERTWMLFDGINNSHDSSEKLSLLGQLHDALRREPANIPTLLPRVFSIKSGFNDSCKVALCRIVDEIVGRGMVPENARTEDEFCGMIEDSGSIVLKRIIRSYTALYPQALMHLYAIPCLGLWKKACDLKLKILSFLQSRNDGVLEYVIRFMHVVILIQLERDKSMLVLPSDKLSLDSCSDNHPFLHREELKMEADLLIKEYLNILSSPDSRIGPLTAIVGGMVGLCIMRPQLQILIGKPLLEITQSPPQGLGNMERESFIRCIRNFFISVYRVSTSSPTSKIFKEAAIALGSKPVDLLKFQKSGKHVLTPTKQAYVTEQAHVAEHAQESTPIEDLLKRIDVNSIPLNQLVDMIIFALGSTPDNKWDLALKVLPNLNIGHDVIGGLNAPPSGQDVMNAATASTVAPCGDVADSTHAPGLLVPNQGAPSMEKDAAQVNDADVTLARIMESQEINGESLFLDILKNIINSEKHFSSGSASILLRDLDSQLGGETDKRMSLSALKIGWYLIISKLSVAPLLSLSRRKVANSDSVMSYKLKTYEILVSFFLRDINSRFESMILWLSHIWMCEMRERKRIGSLKREPVGGYFYWVDYVLERLCTKASLNEKVIARFMIEIPEISDEIINRTVEKYCEQKNRIELGLFILQTLTSLRPAVRDTCLKRLLEYTIRDEKSIRIPAIITCKRLYVSNNTLASEVENFALGSIYALLKEYPSSEKQASILSGTTVPLKEQRDLDKTLSPQASAEKDRIRDKTVAHAELYFVLCSIKQELSAEVFKIFKDLSPEVQKGIAIALDPLIKSLSSQPGRLMDLVKTFPGEADFIAELARNAIRSKERHELQ